MWLHSFVGSASDCESRGCKLEIKPGHKTTIEIDHEIIVKAILPPFTEPRRAVVSYWPEVTAVRTGQPL